MTDTGTAVRIAVPGAAMIAVTFGLARYGYGLLLPEMQTELGVGSQTAGWIASSAYASYLATNVLVVWLTTRFGPRVPIGAAALVAATGMIVIAQASGALSLAVGVVVAGAAAGLAFPPYADVVARSAPSAHRAVSWSVISSGTGWGVTVAAAVAVTLGSNWRTAWLVFAVVTVATGVVAVLAAPGSTPAHARQAPRPRWSWLMCPRSRPLLVSAILVGAGSSVWWAFSVDALRHAGLGETPTKIVYAVCGMAGVLGSATGKATDRIGLRRTYLITCAVLVGAITLLGTATATLAVVMVAAVLFGVSYNAVIAVHGLWSAAVFLDRPSAGLAAVNTALTIGTITGPALAGIVIDHYGYTTALLSAAGVVVLAHIQAPPRVERERATAAVHATGDRRG